LVIYTKRVILAVVVYTSPHQHQFSSNNNSTVVVFIANTKHFQDIKLDTTDSDSM